MKATRADRSWTYARAFFLTLGIGVIALMVIVWFAQGHKSDEWPAFAWTLFAGMILAGVLSCCLALFGSDKTVKKWRASSGTHEAESIIAILAAPVYWIGRRIQGSGRRR